MYTYTYMKNTELLDKSQDWTDYWKTFIFIMKNYAWGALWPNYLWELSVFQKAAAVSNIYYNHISSLKFSGLPLICQL